MLERERQREGKRLNVCDFHVPLDALNPGEADLLTLLQ